MAILGTHYAGEMKKGFFGVMHYLMPARGVLSMHASATEGKKGDVTVLFGLSGTGKTTLSADPKRVMIGDDEHCWTDDGIFNIEGGCYAKCIDLSEETEPDIYRAIKYGAILENIKFKEGQHGVVDYHNVDITENTRAAYPLEHIPNCKIPAVAGHPDNIIYLTCDASGVLPPVAKLTREQAMYHFISGYTAKVAGTEVGITEPVPAFSACFGEAFLPRHPYVYAEMLADLCEKHKTDVWLVNTGWTGGMYGEGHRMSLKATRTIIDGIHRDGLKKAKWETLPVFNLRIPDGVKGIGDSSIFNPRNTWKDKDAYDKEIKKLGKAFAANMEKYTD
jgi:phosphoenolpyruvate carboxykinase (ATP)